MNSNSLSVVVSLWGNKIKSICNEIDQDFLGARGPISLVSSYSLLIGLVYLVFESKPAHITYLYKELDHASKADLQMMGLPIKPSYRQLCYRLDLLEKMTNSGKQQESVIQKLIDLLVAPSAGEIDENRIWAVDGTLFEAWTSQRKSKSADPSATWRKMGTSKHKNKPILGYHLVGLVRTEGTEVCDRIVVTSANVDDGKPAADMIKRALNQNIRVERVLADKGYANKPSSFLEPLRNAGVHLTYDLMDKDHGISATYYGNKIIDGWAYSPSLPSNLEKINKPGPQAGEKAWKSFNALIAQRDAYAFRTQGKPLSNRARVASPASRGKLRCKILGNNARAAAPICKVKHASDEACGVNTMIIESAIAERTYQYPIWGTPDWIEMYSMRSSVERFFGHLQSAALAGFDQGRFCVRGLAKVSIITAVFVIATNLLLLHSANKKAKAAKSIKAPWSSDQIRYYNRPLQTAPLKRGEARSITALLEY